jgi:hypothetical protein
MLIQIKKLYGTKNGVSDFVFAMHYAKVNIKKCLVYQMLFAKKNTVPAA